MSVWSLYVVIGALLFLLWFLYRRLYAMRAQLHVAMGENGRLKGIMERSGISVSEELEKLEAEELENRSWTKLPSPAAPERPVGTPQRWDEQRQH